MAANRGLPLPAAMALPSPSQQSSLGQLPDRWSQGTDETQRMWLQAKMEEERRRQEEQRSRQEEQKTQQEGIRLDVRRTELEMLREAFRGGMPPNLVPVIFTGGGAMAGSSAEWAGHYMAEMQQQTRQGITNTPSMISPELRRNSRLLTSVEHQTPQHTPMQGIERGPPPPPPSMLHHSSSTPNLPGHHRGAPPPPPPPPPGYSPYQHMSPGQRHPQHQPPHPTSDPLHRSTLPRINTDELHVAPAPHGPPGMHMARGPPPMPPMQHGPSNSHLDSQRAPPPPPPSNREPQQDSSPSIFFHHWQPPASQTNSSTPAQSNSPPSKMLDSPFSQGQEGSPGKKRKLGSTSQPHHTPGNNNSFSPTYSSGSSSQGAKPRARGSGVHTRNRSDSGARGYDPYAKSVAARRESRRSDVGYDGEGRGGGGGGSTGSFSINHMTTQDESPELRHRERERQQQHPGSEREQERSQQPYSAGPEMRRDVPSYPEREGSSNPSGGRN